MAWTIVKCNECGEEYRVEMYGPHRNRQWKVENWKGYCDDCKKTFKEQKEKENGFIQLEGSVKQISWAETLRIKRINFIKLLIGEALNENNIEFAEWLRTKIEDTKIQKNASWFIDRRENGKSAFIKGYENFLAKQKAEEFLK